jgi:hypothetical protein
VSLDVCPLNFAQSDLDALDAASFIDQQLVATLLFVVGRRFDATDDGARIPLQLAHLLAD